VLVTKNERAPLKEFQITNAKYENLHVTLEETKVCPLELLEVAAIIQPTETVGTQVAVSNDWFI
jgi:hypothetical protein